MSTNYDAISEQYAECKLEPWRQYVEHATLFELMGSPAEKSVMDLACGDGFYSRLLRTAGAEKVVGVDLSPGMVDLARQQETDKPLGVTYHIGNALDVRLDEKFDIVFASYLFCYARNADELLSMCRTVFHHLKPGGLLVGVINNCEQSPSRWEDGRKNFSFIKSATLPLVEGSPITYTIFQEDGNSFTIDNYYLSVSTHHVAFHTAGFKNLSWHTPRLAEEGIRIYGREYWDAFLTDPPLLFLTAHAPIG